VGIEPVRWGLLSTANINRAVIPGFKESPDSELVAVASRTDARAAEYAKEWGIPKAHGSYEALLADPDVDAVYISLPNGPHVDWSIRALEAGKHVLCEKPLSRRPADVERAFDAADRADRLLMEAFMWRHHPQTKKLAELVRDGAIGEVRFQRTSFSFPIATDADVRLAADLDGGALMDVGCYCISATRLVGGEPLEVSGRQVIGKSGVDVRFVGTLVMPGGSLAQIDCGFDLPDRAFIEVAGSEGRIAIDGPFHARAPGILLERRGEVETIVLEGLDKYRIQGDNFSRAIRGAEEPLLGRADALGQARTIEALYRSADAGGEKVTL
jgi:D-xylose 1-dehydrogenase (NADP+, D-xylono-1,5-lactone-forming)